MLFDTDVLIWFLRGSQKAAAVIDSEDERQISVISYMELIQGARDRNELKMIKSFLSDFGFIMIPLTENIGHRALVYMEEYRLKTGISMADALLAASAVENSLPLCSSNQKHFRHISELELKVFRP